MSQSPQLQTAALGFATPLMFEQAGFVKQYQQAMQAAQVIWQKLNAENPQVAQYVVPNGFNRRVLATFNLREAYAFCQLRAAASAHFSIRRVAQRMFEQIEQVHPLLASYMQLHNETWQGIDQQFFA